MSRSERRFTDKDKKNFVMTENRKMKLNFWSGENVETMEITALPSHPPIERGS